jgi:hypothetical protein
LIVIVLLERQKQGSSTFLLTLSHFFIHYITKETTSINRKMDEELTILTNPDGSGPVVISIGVPAGAAPDVITSTSTNSNDTKSRRRKW